jgi:DNA-directed RNA polymerase III subunit RPC4
MQQAVYLDKEEKQLVVLGEVDKHFVVSPNVEALLRALEKVGKISDVEDKNFIKME